MAGSGGGPCCHFHHAKEGLLLAAPKGPGFKGFLTTLQAKLCHSDKTSSEVLTGYRCVYETDSVKGLWTERLQ